MNVTSQDHWNRGVSPLFAETPMLRFVRLLMIVLAAQIAPHALAKDMPVVDPTDIIAGYGKPDRTVSTEYDKPRPPFVTRMLEYKKENVRIALLANAPMGSPPPYSSWRLMGYQDLKGNEVIAQDEADRRLSTRKRKW